MNEPNTLGVYLRRERELRGLTLKTISESTKVSVSLLEGLEADDVSRWPGGIFRRAFVRSYAECVGLDPDDVFRRFEQQYQPAEPENAVAIPASAQAAGKSLTVVAVSRPRTWNAGAAERRARLLGTAADLTVAVILALGSAAAGSRLLWPVLLIAGYYAIGILLSGTSPMVALLGEQPAAKPSRAPGRAEPLEEASVQAVPARSSERRHLPRRTSERPRQRRGVHAHS